MSLWYWKIKLMEELLAEDQEKSTYTKWLEIYGLCKFLYCINTINLPLRMYTYAIFYIPSYPFFIVPSCENFLLHLECKLAKHLR